MIYQHGRYYWVKFRWLGKLIRKSTRASDLQTALIVEQEIRRALAKSYARRMKVAGDPAALSALYMDVRSLSLLRNARKQRLKKDFRNVRTRDRQDKSFLESLGIKDPPPEAD